MVSKEETGVQWLDTVEHMLVKFENGSRMKQYQDQLYIIHSTKKRRIF